MGLAQRLPLRASPTPDARPEHPLRRPLPPVLLTLIEVLILASVPAKLSSGFPWGAAVALVLLAGAVLTAAIGVAGRLPRGVRSRAKALSLGGLALALVAVAITGAHRSPALLVIGLAIWGVAEAHGIRVGTVAALGGALAAAALGLRGGTLTAASAGALTAAVGMLPFLYGRRLAKAGVRERRLTRLEAHLSRATPAKPMPTAGFLRDVLLLVERTEASQDLETLDRLMRDIRDLLNAEEAIFWRWSEERDTIVPSAWSTEDAPRPEFFRVQEWGPLARWSAQERVVSFQGSDDAPLLAAAPVFSADRLYGVLTLSSNIGLGVSKSAAKEWLPRFAEQIASCMELFDIRTQYGRHMRRNQALLDAMQRLQEYKSAEALGHAVCETALEVSSGRSALLIRWLPQDGYGLVQYASRELEMEPGTIVGKDTLVGRSCRDGLPLVLEDAQSATLAEPAYVTATRVRPIASLVAVPITRDQRVIGAIVVEGAEPGSVTAEEARNIGLLGAVARGSLEVVWEIEEISFRARTDELTGLSNRRHFDEQIKRVLAETDRFGGNSSLILVDIDLFKAVNDTYGHEAGDAVLRQVAKTLGDGVRTVDICARFGGEEIAILLPQTPVSGAIELAERLRRSIADRPVLHEGAAIRVTASFGIAGYPETVPYGDWLFPAADKALYSAKASGRNCVKSLSTTDEMPSNYKRNR
jgi:diguanylate cyclase (GGDEF)-like protein